LNRSEKATFVENLTSGINNAQALAILSFNKIDVESMTSFRLSLKKRKVNVQVVKNTLAKRAFETTPFKEVAKHFEGPTLVIYSDGDPVVTAKAIAEWADKENFDVKIKGGVALGQAMTAEQLKQLSKLPGRNELYVSFLWALKSSPTKFLYGLQDIPRRLGYALYSFKDKREKENKG